MSRMPRRRNASASRQVVATEVKENPETSEGLMASRDDARPNSFASKSKYDGLAEPYVDKLLADEADASGAQAPSLQGVGVIGRTSHFLNAPLALQRKSETSP